MEGILGLVVRSIILSFIMGMSCQVFYETIVPRRKLRYGWVERIAIPVAGYVAASDLIEPILDVGYLCLMLVSCRRFLSWALCGRNAENIMKKKEAERAKRYTDRKGNGI